jgi:hypothetical protein
MSEHKSLLSRIVTWTVIGILAVLALKLVVRLLGFLMGFVGMVFGLVTFLLFTVGPLVLIGWLASKAYRAFTREPAA